MASCFPPTRISRDQFREIFGIRTRNLMKMIQTSTSQALRPGGMKKATVKVRKQAVKQARIPLKQKLHGLFVRDDFMVKRKSP